MADEAVDVFKLGLGGIGIGLYTEAGMALGAPAVHLDPCGIRKFPDPVDIRIETEVVDTPKLSRITRIQADGLRGIPFPLVMDGSGPRKPRSLRQVRQVEVPSAV
jgi:hypothetical protein